MTVGAVLVGAAVAVWAGYWIYTLANPSTSIWSWPTWVSIAVTVVGATMMARGMLLDRQAQPAASRSRPTMKQTGGRNSTNIQSGRDSIVYRTEGEER